MITLLLLALGSLSLVHSYVFRPLTQSSEAVAMEANALPAELNKKRLDEPAFFYSANLLRKTIRTRNPSSPRTIGPADGKGFGLRFHHPDSVLY